MESSANTEEVLAGGAVVEKKLESFEDQEKVIKEAFNEKQI